MIRLLGMAALVALPTAVVGAGPYYNDPAAAPGAPLVQTFVGGGRDAPHPAVCRVIASEGNGNSMGSGTLVGATGNLGLVVSNWHVVRDARGPIAVVFPNGFRSWARVLRVDRDWDLAALAIWRPEVQPVPIATYRPSPGEPLVIAGYGSGSYRMAAGRCTDYYSPGGNLPAEIVEVSVGARQGDSGGPIFNAKGELSGVLFGTSFGRTMGSYGGRVRGFLLTVLDDFQRLEPSVQVAQQPAAAPSQTAVATPPRAQIVVAAAQHAGPAAVESWSPEISTATQSSSLVAVSPPAPEPQSDSSRVAYGRGQPSLVGGGKNSSVKTAGGWRGGDMAATTVSTPQESRTATSPPPRIAAAESPTSAPVAAVSGGPELDLPFTVNWSELLGATRGEQIKTVLAIIGALGIFWQGMRAFAIDGPGRRSRRSRPTRRTRYYARRYLG